MKPRTIGHYDVFGANRRYFVRCNLIDNAPAYGPIRRMRNATLWAELEQMPPPMRPMREGGDDEVMRLGVALAVERSMLATMRRRKPWSWSYPYPRLKKQSRAADTERRNGGE